MQQFGQSPPEKQPSTGSSQDECSRQISHCHFPLNTPVQCPGQGARIQQSPSGLNATALQHSPHASIFVNLPYFSANRWSGSASFRSAAISIRSSAPASQMTLTACKIFLWQYFRPPLPHSPPCFELPTRVLILFPPCQTAAPPLAASKNWLKMFVSLSSHVFV